MNILLIHQYFLEQQDGGGSRFNEMSRIWREQGHRITIIAGMVHYNRRKKPKRYHRKYTFVDKTTPNETVIRCHVSDSYNAGFVGRLWGYFSFVVSSIFAGLFRARDSYDVILVSSPPLFVGITALILSIAKRVPFVFEVRDLWPESAIDTGVLTNRVMIRAAYWFESLLYRRAKKINVLTPAFQTQLVRHKNVPAEKVHLIPNAANFALAESVAAEFNRDSFRRQHDLTGKKVLIYVGAHGVANHLIQAIEAAQLLQERDDILFLFIGDGMQKSMLVSEANQRRLNNVRFVGLVPRVKVFEYILAADIGASILKRVDTFKTIYSNKTFDYMACKKPILMAIDGISRQLVEDAGCGVYAEPENARDFAAKLCMLADLSDDDRRQMGTAGFQYAKANFDRHTLGLAYLDLLDQTARLHN